MPGRSEYASPNGAPATAAEAPRRSPQVDTSICIDAPPARVWRILLDVEAYPEWTQFLSIPGGEICTGRPLDVRARLSGWLTLPFKADLVEVEPDLRIRWVGGLPVPGLFTGEHAFTLEPEDGGTRLRQYERYSGLLSPILGPWLAARSRPGFEQMNSDLKKRAEHHEGDDPS